MKNILITDDSPTIRKSAEYALKKLDYNVLQAENGQNALDKIKELKSKGEEISLCVVDINMPVMGGLEFIELFRKEDKYTPVMVLTTESEQSMIEKGKAAGATGWIIKPFNPTEFQDIVKRHAR